MKEFKYRYGSRDAGAERLVLSDDMIVVRTVEKAPLEKSVRTKTARNTLAKFTTKMTLPDDGVTVLRAKADANENPEELRDKARTSLGRLKTFRFAGRALKDPRTQEPVVYTENLFVKFKDEVDEAACKAILAEEGLELKRSVGYAANAFFAAADGRGLEVFDIANRMLEREEVEYCHPELIRERKSRAAHPRQWHLQRTAIDGVVVDAHANVAAAWPIATGAGVTIAVIDDGFDIQHQDFSQDGKLVAPFDATQGTDDPRPKDPLAAWDRFENHGTACAGVACASGLFGASGVAPGAKLMPIRLGADLDGLREGEAIAHAADNGADIISCSWGPPDGVWWDSSDPLHLRSSPLPASTRLALEYAVAKGRGGKGCVIVWAAGNGNESVDLDGYASSPLVIAVAACNDRGRRSVYSDYGDAIWCSFPSNDFGDPGSGHPDPLTSGIWTTDRSNVAGYNPGRRFPWEPTPPGDDAGHYSSTFGGTSSAAPGVAGLVALLLERQPNLTWQDVRDRIRQSCIPIDVANGAYDETGHSPYYGYGRPDALALLGLAVPRAARPAAPKATLREVRRAGARLFTALRTPSWIARSRDNRGPRAQAFSQFDDDGIAGVLWTLMGFHLAVQSTSGDEAAKLSAVLDFAERRARVQDPESVRHALAVFATHNPLGRLLEKPRSVHHHPSHFVSRVGSRAGSAVGARATVAPHPEQALDYWREDALANEHHEHWHEVYPNSGIAQFEAAERILGPAGWARVLQKWQAVNGNFQAFVERLTGEEFRACFQLNDRHGELFLYMHQQMLARCDAERMAVGLPLLEPFDLATGAIDVGYQPPPELQDATGLRGRPPNTRIPEGARQQLSLWRDAIEVSLTDGIPSADDPDVTLPMDIEALGRVTEAVDGRYMAGGDTSGFGNLHNAGHGVISSLSGRDGGVMGRTSTAIRDPIFWRWHKLIDNFAADFQNGRAPFDFSDRPPVRFARGANDIGLIAWPNGEDPDLIAPIEATVRSLPADAPLDSGQLDIGTMQTVTMTSTLTTFMAERSPVVPAPPEGLLDPGAPTPVRYLNHDAFGYLLRVESLAAEDVTCTFRVFICPRQHASVPRAWIEMDKFTRRLSPGVNAVYQSDTASSVINKPAEDPIREPDPTPPHETPGPICDCGWPYTLLVPRGTAAPGTEYLLAVVLTDTAIDLAVTDHTCGSMSFCGATDRYPDSREMGYPFSRPFTGPVEDVLDAEPQAAVRAIAVVHRP